MLEEIWRHIIIRSQTGMSFGQEYVLTNFMYCLDNQIIFESNKVSIHQYSKLSIGNQKATFVYICMVAKNTVQSVVPIQPDFTKVA